MEWPRAEHGFCIDVRYFQLALILCHLRTPNLTKITTDTASVKVMLTLLEHLLSPPILEFVFFICCAHCFVLSIVLEFCCRDIGLVRELYRWSSLSRHSYRDKCLPFCVSRLKKNYILVWLMLCAILLAGMPEVWRYMTLVFHPTQYLLIYSWSVSCIHTASYTRPSILIWYHTICLYFMLGHSFHIWQHMNN